MFQPRQYAEVKPKATLSRKRSNDRKLNSRMIITIARHFQLPIFDASPCKLDLHWQLFSSMLFNIFQYISIYDDG